MARALTTIYPGPPIVPFVGGFFNGSISGVNNSGTVVGVISKANDDRPYRWNGSGGAPVALGHSSATGVVGINNLGTAIGFVNGGSPVRWDPAGTPAVNMALPPGWLTGFPSAINDAGVIVGYGGGAAGLRAVRWTNNGASAVEMGTVAGFDADASYSAFALNSAGMAVGQIRYNPMPADVGSRPLRWDAAGTATQLGELGTYPDHDVYDTSSAAYSINSAGTAVGEVLKFVGSNLGHRAVRWDAGSVVPTELGNLGTNIDGGAALGARVINESGTIAGWGEKYGPTGIPLGNRAIRWNSGQTAAIELGGLGTNQVGIFNIDIGGVHAMNAAGTIVGSVPKFDQAGDFQGQRAVYWGANATAVDLNSLIDPASGWVLTGASAISDTGWIAGNGFFDPDGAGGQEAYDRMFLLQLPRLAGDFDENGVVNAADLSSWKAGFGGASTAHLNGNSDADGDVDGADFLVWQRQFGSASAVLAAAQQIPEPTASAFALLAGCALALPRPRRR